ncbi:zinc-ribbon domain-containing protein [Yinghuangia aomiensis]
MGTLRITDANRLSVVKPKLAATLNVEKSGIDADELTVGAGRKVWWNCPDFPDEHEPWEAVVNNRTGGSASATAPAARPVAYARRPCRNFG